MHATFDRAVKALRSRSNAIKTGAVFFVFILVFCFNLALCSRVLAPGKTAAFLLALVVPLTVFIFAIAFERLRNKCDWLSLEIIVCFFVLILGIAFSVVFPPFSIPDETAHYRSVYSISNALLLRGTDAVMRADDLSFLEAAYQNGGYISQEYYQSLIGNLRLFIEDPSLIDTDRVAPFSFAGVKIPHVYLASAVGFSISQIAGFSTIVSIYFARFFNLAVYIVLLFIAIRNIPQGKRILSVVALLPMTIHQVASLSYDATILGMAFLLLALILKAISEERRISRKEAIAIVVISCLLAPCKVVYSLISLLALFISNDKFESRLQGIVFKVLVFGLSILYICLTSLFSISLIAENQAPEEGMRGYALSSIAERPGWFINLFINTCFERSDFLLFSMLGYWLGSFQEGLQLPIAFFMPFLFILLLAAIRNRKEYPLRPAIRISMLAIFVCVFLLTTLTMFLAFTKIGFEVIDGVQGRYFLPVLPLLLFGLMGKTIVTEKDYTYLLVYSESVLSSFVVCINFSLALTL